MRVLQEVAPAGLGVDPERREHQQVDAGEEPSLDGHGVGTLVSTANRVR